MARARQERVALIVDDEVFARIFASQILEDEGYAAFEAESSVEALDILDQGHAASVLITDIGMPGDMDGLALARAVASAYPGMAIVIVSGQARPSRASMPFNARFLAKPYTAQGLMSVVREVAG